MSGALAIAFLAALTLFHAEPAAADPVSGHAESRISESALSDTAEGRRASVVILLADEVDVSAAYSIRNHDARGQYVYERLVRHAEETQSGIRALLASENVNYRSFWITNMLVAEVDRSLLLRLAERSEVASIHSNRGSFSAEPADSGILTPGDELAAVPAAAEWNITNVNAPGVWSLGYTGQGIVIGEISTGVRWTHAAIKAKYRGWNGTTASHDYNWHDAVVSGGGSCGPNTPQPCDDNGSGTHNVGVIIGDDGSANQVGVAPGAKWIGCRSLNTGNGTVITYLECLQFMLAPTDSNGMNPDSTRRPHILNSVWECTAASGCTNGNELSTAMGNLRAAGIFVSSAAGNDGPACSTIAGPPASYRSVFTVGSITSTNALSSFSSRGPVSSGGLLHLKPNLTAPGSSIRSATNTSDSAYTSFSGTSRSASHVSGIVALLWSARPEIARDVLATTRVLQGSASPSVTLTAQTCGGISSTQIPNYSFGFGRVDALAAVNSAAALASVPFDFDGDRRSDVGIYRPSVGEWWYMPSSSGSTAAAQFGAPGDITVPADHTGDGKTDIAAFRPSTGFWYILRSENYTFYGFPFGANGDIPVPGDYDADGKSDAAVFRTSNGYWYIALSGGGSIVTPLGFGTDRPVPADYDADGKTDVAVFRPSNGSWWIRRSASGQMLTATFGTGTDKVVPADYTGDGAADIAVWRPSNGTWYVLRSENFSFYAVPFGMDGDLPAQADYDGDGRADTAIFRPSNGLWYLNRTAAGPLALAFGTTGDMPIAGAYVR